MFRAVGTDLPGRRYRAVDLDRLPGTAVGEEWCLLPEFLAGACLVVFGPAHVAFTHQDPAGVVCQPVDDGVGRHPVGQGLDPVAVLNSVCWYLCSDDLVCNLATSWTPNLVTS
jgi:hypothetical protein